MYLLEKLPIVVLFHQQQKKVNTLPGLHNQAQCEFLGRCGRRWHGKLQRWCQQHLSAPWKARHEHLEAELKNKKITTTKTLFDCNHVTEVKAHTLFIPVTLPVTLVPMMRGNGISSGRSLQVDTSDNFLCCRRRIFWRFCLRAVRSSAKKADEHLGGSLESSNEMPILFHCRVQRCSSKNEWKWPN